jgi:TonB family protein
MTLHRQDRTQLTSDGAALVVSVVVLGVFFIIKPDVWHTALVHPLAGQAGIEVSLLQEVAAPPTPPPPVSRKVPVHHLTPRPETVPDPLPAELQNMPVEAAVPEGGAVVAASNAAASSPAVVDPRPELEAQYAAGLRADIDRRTHPPDSAQYRLHRTSGEVRVGFILMRNGEPKVVHVLRTSGSSILDDTALAIVSAGHYPPMSAKIFVGEAEHAFAVTIEFRAPS